MWYSAESGHSVPRLLLSLVVMGAGFACNTAQAQQAQGQGFDFDSGFLQGQSRGMDVSRFAEGSPVMAGRYLADVYINGDWLGREEVEFKVPEGEEDARTCFTLERLDQLGVDTQKLDLPDVNLDTCLPLEAWVEGAFARFDTGVQRLDLSVPQASMRRSARGYVDPRLWEPGINAGFLNYNFNAFHNRSRGSVAADDGTLVDRWNTSDLALLNMDAGYNLGAWQLRHSASYSVRDGDADWQNIATYAKRPLPGWHSELLLGDSFTDGNLFDSVGFRGVNIATDDRMLPDSLRGYAPVIRGTAESEARVEVRQRGQLIYQTAVSAGPFVIDDLYPTGYGGDLDVTVIEADGRERNFSVPFAAVPRMLREGHQRYDITVGEVREASVQSDPMLAQWTYEHGLTNSLTGYTGMNVSDGYVSVQGGAAVATPVGAVSFDVTQAKTKFDDNPTRQGQSYRLGYSKLVDPTRTNISVAAYRYATQGFLGLREAVLARDLEQQGLDIDALRRRRSELQLTISQSLPEHYGSLYLTGSWRDYWDDEGDTQNFQVGYNNRWGIVNYGISALRTTDAFGDDDMQYSLNLSMPITTGAGSASLSSSLGLRDGDYDSSRIGLSGRAGDEGRFNYNVTASDGANRDPQGSVTGQYRSDIAQLRASQSVSRNSRQTNLGASGTVVAHGGGVTFSPQRGDTLVLVEADGAAGAEVASSAGVRVDGNGYAVVPFVSPYRQNVVSLDPNGMSTEVELKNTRQTVAPYAGAIAHVKFETVAGRALLIRVRTADGEPLQFGSQVYDETGQPVAIVTQGGRIYLRTEAESGRLRVEGEGDAPDCYLDYSVASGTPSDSGYTHLEAHCER
ncbi:fimbria/pilus outer membrane usher protein [Halomonas urumqiensis]|nr:fimbria/pilus outer membrane usher protein [Halomonas urumqiensis]GHE20787.1 outer membrane usher protein [Halomonas urumqiensis]